MAQHESFVARRVVTGFDERGRSTVVEDTDAPARHVGAGNTKCDIWRLQQVPSTTGDDGLAGPVETHPPAAGLVHRVVAMAPDDEWDPAAGYTDASGPLKGSIPADQIGGVTGMHWTPTVDLVTVICGELTCVLQDGEVVLGPGDTLVQNGTVHAWRNRGSVPAVIVSVMCAASDVTAPVLP